MSRGAGAGREHSQAASPSWPVEIFLAMDFMLSLGMGVGQRAGIFLCSSHFREFEPSLVWEFELFWEFGLFREFTKSVISKFRDHCLGTGCKSVFRW